MNGLMRATAVAVAAGGAAVTGCAGTGTGLGDRYKNAVDPCWPERYSAVAREEALAPFQAQAMNGDILDKTLWNYHFDSESDKISAAGLEKLGYLVRRRPTPDSKVYVQAARDVSYDPAAADKTAESARLLNEKRVAAVQKYLAVATAGRPMTFDVAVIDPAFPGFGAQYPVNAVRQLANQYTATRGGGGGGGAAAGGGAPAGGQ